MATRDLVNDIDLEVLHLGTNFGTSGTASGHMDLKGYESCTLIFFTATAANTATLAVTVQDSDETGSGWADVADEFLIGSESDLGYAAAHGTNNDNRLQKIGYKGPKRYVRLRGVAGVTATPGYVFAIRGHPHLRPTD